MGSGRVEETTAQGYPCRLEVNKAVIENRDSFRVEETTTQGYPCRGFRPEVKKAVIGTWESGRVG